jgi:ribosomal protein S27AE
MHVDKYETVSAKIISAIADCPHCGRSQLFGIQLDKLQAVRCSYCLKVTKLASREEKGVVLVRRHWEEE